MLKTLDLKTHILFSHTSLQVASLQSPKIVSHPSQPHQIHTQHQNPIASARGGRRRTRKSLPRSSARLFLNLASLAASNLNLLPHPLDFVLREIADAGDGGSGSSGGGGGGGNIGFRNGFGWGDFGGFGRRRGKRKNDLWLYGLAAICGLGFVLWREAGGNAAWWALGFGPLGVAVVRWWERSGGVQGWVFLGFCVWSFVVGLSFGRGELQKWVSRVRVSLPMVGTLRGRTRGGRRRSGRRVF